MMFAVWRASAATNIIPEWQKNFADVEKAVSLLGSGLFFEKRSVWNRR